MLLSSLRISELFISLQGEGTFVGLPTFFVRLAGCNLKCRWCDTAYAQTGGEPYTIEKIVDEWERSKKLPWVQITGGEPLLQEGVYPLMKAFLRKGATVLLETNGSLSLAQVPKEVVKIMDLKCPSSGMTDYMKWENLAFLTPKDQVKFVIANREDYEWAKGKVQELYLPYFTQVLFSPVYKVLAPQKLAEWILKDGLRVRFQLQLHKILWGDRPGV